MLADLMGRSVILRTLDQSRKAERPERILVATEDERIREEVEREGGQVIMTSPDHQSGTERCAEALEKLNGMDPDIVINLQGDEPFIRPDQIDRLHELLSHPEVGIGTLAAPLQDPKAMADPNRVKPVFDPKGRCLYFSRAPIPYYKEGEEDKERHQHIGIYAYRAELLPRIAELSHTPLERSEGLEQLRWIEHGYDIHVAVTQAHPSGIDSPEDLERAEREFSKGKN